MNKFENWFCGSSLWRFGTERKLLPWILSGYALGDHVLEVGAGQGATTHELLRRAGRVTSLEYDPAFVSKLAERHKATRVTVVRGDAATLPFPDHTFSSVVAVLVLHHLRSRVQQNEAFQEFHRVLRPGGMFVPVSPASAFARLTVAGFSRIAVDIERTAFRVCALRATEA